MPPTLVNAAFGALLAAALLGSAFDRRSAAVVTLAAAAPDLDAVASLAVPGATNALFHTLFVPAAAAAAVGYDTRVRSPEASWLRRRAGPRGVRLAWVAVAAYLVAGIGLDLFSYEAVNLLYPVHDRFYAVVGWFILSTADGVILTYVDLDAGILGLHSPGTTATHHVATWVNPTPGTDVPSGAERRLRLFREGWHAVAIAAAAAVVTARLRWVTDGDRTETETRAEIGAGTVTGSGGESGSGTGTGTSGDSGTDGGGR